MITPEQVTSAGRVELHRLNLEILQTAISGGDTDKARAALSVLAEALDMRYEMAQKLMPVYIYVNKLLLNGDAQSLTDAAGIVADLAKGWAGVPDEPLPPQPTVIAGLTYTKDGLSEYPDGGGHGYEA